MVLIRLWCAQIIKARRMKRSESPVPFVCLGCRATRGGGNVQEIPKAQGRGKQPQAVPGELQAGNWENSSMEWAGAPSLPGSKCAGGTWGTWGSGNVGLEELGGLFQPEQFCNSVFPTGKGNSKAKKAPSKWEFDLCDVVRFVGRGISRVSVEK